MSTRDLILYMGDETFEQAAEREGWTRHENGIDWMSPGGEFIEGSAESACKIDGIDPKGDVEIILPYRWAICPVCDGCGTDRGRSVECDGGGFTSAEWAEQDDDFKSEYLAGHYDQPCGCEGGRVRVPDYSKMSKKLIEAWEAQQREDADYDRLCRMERMMGA